MRVSDCSILSSTVIVFLIYSSKQSIGVLIWFVDSQQPVQLFPEPVVVKFTFHGNHAHRAQTIGILFAEVGALFFCESHLSTLTQRDRADFAFEWPGASRT